MYFKIDKIEKNRISEINEKLNSLTKPVGSLGKLEEIALQICCIQNNLNPLLKKPVLFLFAADHGITEEGVSPCPKSVTWQMVYNFLNGGGAINVFCDQNGIELKIVDSGVDYNFPQIEKLISKKIRKGTSNYLYEPAMTEEECESAIRIGAELVENEFESGTNVIAFGEMGISNTSSASIILSKIVGIPLAECVGKGAGHNEEGIKHKLNVLTKAINKHPLVNSPMEILKTFGGFEIAMMVGGMLKAAEKKMIILVDGFIHTSAVLAANAIDSNLKDYCIFSHHSNETAHSKMLEYLKVDPLINLNLRLGEGTGSAIAYSIVKSAVLMMNKMETFQSANVALNDVLEIEEKIKKHT